MPGAIIQTNCQIGRFCIVNTGASIDHDSTMKDYSSLAPQACTGGNVTIGAFSAIGLNACLKHRVAIGDHTVVGAGATVLDDFPANTVVYGTPARQIRSRTAGEPYL